MMIGVRGAAATLSVRPGTPAHTSTFGAWGCGVATYDSRGRLLGVEVKARVSLGDGGEAGERCSPAVPARRAAARAADVRVAPEE
jgi:hypothetical protein